MRVCIFGKDSDIAKGLIPLLEADGHDVWGWNRFAHVLGSWDLIISCLGSVAPVGPWHQTKDWNECFESNLLTPIKWLQEIWHLKSNNAQVCFLAGSNPQKIMPGYAPYNASKMALLKVVEQLDFETPECKFFALGPGYMDTKIHKPTLDAGWPNERITRGNPNTIQQVYDCLKWCLAQSKADVGGRNICVSDRIYPGRLQASPDLFKIRRVE